MPDLSAFHSVLAEPHCLNVCYNLILNSLSIVCAIVLADFLRRKSSSLVLRVGELHNKSSMLFLTILNLGEINASC